MYKYKMVKVTVRRQVKAGGKASRAYHASSRRIASGKYMRKTTKKGAYRKGAKKAMMNRRAPFTETKSKTTEDIHQQFGLVDHINFQTFNTPTANINPDVFHAWKQGLGENEMIGQSVFVKYLKRKMTIRFPQPNVLTTNGQPGVVPVIPQRYELIWGFVPAPLTLTGSTTPPAYGCDMSYINGYINERVKDYVDNLKDKLRFIPKKASTLRIIGRKKIRPNLNRSSTAPLETHVPAVGNPYAVGSIPDRDVSIYWPMMRKVHLERSFDLHGNNEGYFPNYSWLPFAVLVSWDWESIPSAQRPEQVCNIAYNDAIYYTDS